MPYQVIFARELLKRATDYGRALADGSLAPGKYLSQQIQSNGPGNSPLKLLERLLQTKHPQIFAESAVAGDGRDWNAAELSLLGDISIATDVEIYDDGRHQDPAPHQSPFQGTLVFTCGALFRSGFSNPPPDFQEVVRQGTVDEEAFTRLYQRRLEPVFAYIQASAEARERTAIVTVPGLGCGQFAGRFGGTLGPKLQRALAGILEGMHPRPSRIRVVRFDPYGECQDSDTRFGALTFRTRPLLSSRNPRPQLCRPATYEETGDDFSDCDLYSLVAWDQVSWPGNDFYVGSRATDDGVKAAATSSMLAMTGIAGRYDPRRAMYLPPDGYSDWGECVRRNKLSLQLGEPFVAN